MPANYTRNKCSRRAVRSATNRNTKRKRIKNERRMEATTTMLLLYDRYILFNLYPPINNSFVLEFSPHPRGSFFRMSFWRQTLQSARDYFIFKISKNKCNKNICWVNQFWLKRKYKEWNTKNLHFIIIIDLTSINLRHANLSELKICKRCMKMSVFIIVSNFAIT